jgi:tetratricopeptide (TPR) repeat protein
MEKMPELQGMPSDIRSRPLRGVAGFLVSLLACGFLGCASDEESRDYGAAAEASAAEDWENAAELWYEVYSAEDPRTVGTYRETARALFENGDPGSACAMLDLALSEFPGNLELLECKASLLDRCGHRRAAEGTYAQLVALDPDGFSAHAALGRLRLQLGLERAAEPPLLRALELREGDAATHACLGHAYLALGRLTLAFSSFSRAIELGNVDHRTLLDASSLAIDDEVVRAIPDARQRALEWLDTLCAIDPQCTVGHYLRGLYLIDLDRSDEALVALRRAVETDPACLEALRRLAFLYADLGDLPRTLEMVERALELEPDQERRDQLEGLLLGG